ncbi:MAG: ligase-associated DNA damage response exonuclease [Isosphaeraceae bacterium]|nr:ligase-associated DNA damage response exonuclease [Isosphaeraceae bacterium]
MPLLETTERGLYCPAGDFFVDPWRPVARAVVTHAHADHACGGCERYLTTRAGRHVLQARVGFEAAVDALEYGEPLRVNDVAVSLHPAGHILGSAQVRVEQRGEVWVVSGDYKVEPDPTCAAFEPVRCHVFVSESTFGLPIYRWSPEADVFADVNAWWRANQAEGKASVLFAYSLGKAQRLLAGVDRSVGPIACHGAVENMNRMYRATGVDLPETSYVGEVPRGADWGRSLIVAPPSANGSAWMRRFGPSASGFASGWMRVRGARRRRAVDRGFVLSDHADWPGLLGAIAATGAERVLLTHGFTAALARRLVELGVAAEALVTGYQGERDDPSPGETEADAAGPESREAEA